MLTRWLYQKHKRGHSEHKVTKCRQLSIAAVTQTSKLALKLSATLMDSTEETKKKKDLNDDLMPAMIEQLTEKQTNSFDE